MAGISSPRSDEAASSGQVEVTKAPGADAASSDDLIGVPQPDVQRQQEVWVKYTTLQEGMPDCTSCHRQSPHGLVHTLQGSTTW